MKTFKYYHKCNIETIFNAGTAGTIADIQSGALYSLTIGTVPSGTNDFLMVVNYRIRFQDM